ncbi:hypothetical protein PENANT_c002G03792 [Penicillium antarcticum]|uniref:Arrestin C-terminal-like domain-containing protein n=1 Tax=Penicillium antarcticum TaxID=416450 RepID=A0A1V6QL08_9EURO|nr:hypothetical protein PENANT_c002G03792 [Penicillium antarcticum]
MVRTLPRESNFQKRETAELVPYLGPEAIIATGHGMNLGIALSESVLFLERYDKEDPSTKKCTILRGQLRLSVTKPTRLKKVWIRFCGQMQMVWPGGITYFDRGGTAMHRNDFGADSFDLLKAPTATANAHLMTTTNASLQVGQPGASKVCLTQTGYSVEDTATCHSKSNEAQSQSGSKLFPAGDFLYSFEFLLDGSLPETIKTDLSSIQYSLEAFVEPSRHLRSNLTGKLEIPVVRLPAESPLELTEPVMISGNWRDQLHYRMVMSGKSFPLGSQIPISLKLTPMSKVACQWVKVYVTEHVQHWSRGKEAGLLQIPSKKVLLFENQAGLESVSTYPGSEMRIISSNSRDGSVKLPLENSSKTNLLGGSMSSDTGIELNVQLPSCFEMKDREKSQCLCLDSKNEILTVSHWIQVKKLPITCQPMTL